MRRNIAASVRTRLRNIATTRAEEFQLTLLRYACERFLYRLGASPASDRCVLKGGSLLAADAFDFEGVALREALTACFSRRRTTWSLETPPALTTPFYAAAQGRWRDYLDKGALVPPPASFVEIGERIRLFIGPVRESVVADTPFAQRWAAGGPWRPT